jgi:hypothetical protein
MSDNSFIVLGASTSTWLRQKIDPRSWVRFFGEELMPEYKEKMELLREVDDKIFSWTKDLEKIVKAMRKALDQGQLVDLAVLLTNLNNKLLAVSFETNKVKDIAQDSITQFEKDRGSAKLWAKEAGIIDDLKRKFFYSKLSNKAFLKERNAVLRGIINLAEKTVYQAETVLKQMSDARISGEIGRYIAEANKINNIQKNFQYHFGNVYNKYLRSLVDQIQEKQQAQQPINQKEILPDYQEPEVTLEEPKSEESKVKEPKEVEEVETLPENKEEVQQNLSSDDIKALQEAAKKINLPETEKIEIKRHKPLKEISKMVNQDIPVTEDKPVDPVESILKGKDKVRIAEELISSILMQKLSKEEMVDKIITASEEMESIDKEVSKNLCFIANKLINE